MNKKEFEKEVEKSEKEEKARLEVSYEIVPERKAIDLDEKLVSEFLMDMYQRAKHYGFKGDEKRERRLKKLVGMLNEALESHISDEKHNADFLKHFGGGK